jgi:hypothetical protein
MRFYEYESRQILAREGIPLSKHGFATAGTQGSESDGSIMGPCTKGATGASLRPQPFGTIKAKPRAWALKPSFTWQLYQAITRPKPVESLLEDFGLSAAEQFVLTVS